MKIKVIISIIVILLIIAGGIILMNIIPQKANNQNQNTNTGTSNSQISEEQIKANLEERERIIKDLEDVIKGIENPTANYQISIKEAKEKAITIFSKIGEKGLTEQNVKAVETVIRGVKYYIVSSLENDVHIEINTGKVTRINNVTI